MKQIVLDFLSELKENNTREWFQANKKQYEAAKSEVEQFVNLVIPGIAKFDESLKFVTAKDCMFRIFRDVRFSHDKSPYKINMGAWMSGKGRKSSGPGYYIHFQPGESFLAAGVYMPMPDQLKKIRSEIYYNAAEFKSILADPGVRNYAKELSDYGKSKMAPRDFPRDFPDIDLLKYKHYTLDLPLSDKEVLSTKFHEEVLRVFRAWYPFNTFLHRALEE
ncbi:MAG TPA: DUF2461 domain-containing protein [Bacteroidales bacterium]|nr:DUF2461 domain-containing protein [Bacteroidales bacterium]HPS62212.1 DUF2461 domain-containing protein [Bacteroidales bacterium]